MLCNLNDKEKKDLVLLVERSRISYELHNAKMAEEQRLKAAKLDAEARLQTSALKAQAHLNKFQDYVEATAASALFDPFNCSSTPTRSTGSDSAESISFDYKYPTKGEVLHFEASMEEEPQTETLQATNDEVLLCEAMVQGREHKTMNQATNAEGQPFVHKENLLEHAHTPSTQSNNHEVLACTKHIMEQPQPAKMQPTNAEGQTLLREANMPDQSHNPSSQTIQDLNRSQLLGY